jgi:hypothetical protein
MAVDTVIQQTREAPEIEARRLALMDEAKELIQRQQSLPAFQIAELSPMQQQAMQLAQAGIGGYQPFLQSAQQAIMPAAEGVTSTTAKGIGALDQSLAGISGGTQAFDPASTQQYMNPFEQQVIDQALKDIERQRQVQAVDLRGRAARSGAFGGTREAITQAEIARNTMEQQARTAGNLRAQGYQNALQQAQTAFENQQRRQLQGAEIGGRLGQAVAGLGTQQAQALGNVATQTGALGELGQSLYGQDIKQLMGVGGIQQQQQQNVLEAARQTAQAQRTEPFERLAFLSDIYRGVPSTQQTMKSTTTPSPSPFQQVAGLGIAGLSAAAGAKNLGLI